MLSLLPIAYLLLRAAGTDADALAFIARPRTLSIVMSSVLLGLVVGAGSVLVGLPIAWLTTRTNLPGRRAWALRASHHQMVVQSKRAVAAFLSSTASDASSLIVDDEVGPPFAG